MYLCVAVKKTTPIRRVELIERMASLDCLGPIWGPPSNPSDHHSIMVLKGLKEVIYWVLILPLGHRMWFMQSGESLFEIESPATGFQEPLHLEPLYFCTWNPYIFPHRIPIILHVISQFWTLIVRKIILLTEKMLSERRIKRRSSVSNQTRTWFNFVPTYR